MADQPDELALSLRHQLESGVAADAVIDDLVRGGLSRKSAERFVERALAGPFDSPSDLTDRPVQSSATPDASRGATHEAAGATSSAPPRTGRLAALIAVATIAAVVGVMQWRSATTDRSRQHGTSTADLARDDVGAADLRAAFTVDEAAAFRSRAADLDTALKQFRSGRPTAQCDAASRLGRYGSQEHVAPLVELLTTATSSRARVCAAAALAALGDTATVMAAYKEWAASRDADLRLAAITGYGDLGPPAARTALPFLRRELRSSNWETRYLVVESLAKLGPGARSLLATASKDADPRVRQRASALLKR
jgi:HEAT repeat protein